MPLTPEEKNEYDHKVIYDDLLRRIKSAGSRITSLSGRTDDLESDYGTISDSLSEAQRDISSIRDAVGDLESDYGSISTSLSDAQRNITSIRETADNNTVQIAYLKDDFAKFQESLDDLNVTTKLQFGSGSELTSSNGKTTVPLGYGMTWRNNALDTKVRIFTDQATADANAVEGDVLIIPSGLNVVDGIPGAVEGKFIYTGNQINGINSTYIVESTHVGQYYFQRAFNVNDSGYQYVRILKGDGTNNTSESGWKLSYAQWA